jgi:hypothetical protein
VLRANLLEHAEGRRAGGGGEPGPDVEKISLDSQDLLSYLSLMLGERRNQGPKHGIELVHFAASLDAEVGLVDPFSAEQAGPAAIAASDIGLHSRPPCISFMSPPMI